ncbi:hypothetical protein [Parapedobacter koreensis]|uniref:Lipocalin-like domain-containing protein n=1 Tax=Parapedobacter koreensis TaxID=332977 RepID=A0A1H7NRM6_9SPHI|nr:hypothetical protein [Parapedobacter koreensis]SEL26066.1 hypothetical protein SAMN05421740_10478 [Parapedobacter koreensis]
MKKLALLLFIGLSLFIGSCKKREIIVDRHIIGKWRLVSIERKSYVDGKATDGGYRGSSVVYRFEDSLLTISGNEETYIGIPNGQYPYAIWPTSSPEEYGYMLEVNGNQYKFTISRRDLFLDYYPPSGPTGPFPAHTFALYFERE